MTLEEEIAEAQLYTAAPPKNESNTCDWVILPLLQAIYPKRDIESRIADNGGKYPDYTVLPGSDFKWYVEAKAWNVPLEDSHAQQALNYANHNGKRFVVLTNGQTWRLYDNTVLGLITDKLITSVTLLDTGALTTFLTALSKTEVLSGGLERYVEQLSETKKQEALERRQQAEGEAEARRSKERQAELITLLHAMLPVQLGDAESGIIELITLYLSEIEEFKGIKAEMVTRWFREIFSPSPQSREVPSVSIEKRMPPPMFSVVNGDRTLNLRDMQSIPINGKKQKPIVLHLPDGTHIGISSWVGFAEQAVRWLLRQPRPLPIPFESGSRERWFLNHIPKHKRDDSRALFKTISVPGTTAYMDDDRSGQQFLQDIHALCLAVGVPPEGFRITFRA